MVPQSPDKRAVDRQQVGGTGPAIAGTEARHRHGSSGAGERPGEDLAFARAGPSDRCFDGAGSDQVVDMPVKPAGAPQVAAEPCRDTAGSPRAAGIEVQTGGQDRRTEARNREPRRSIERDHDRVGAMCIIPQGGPPAGV